MSELKLEVGKTYINSRGAKVDLVAKSDKYFFSSLGESYDRFGLPMFGDREVTHELIKEYVCNQKAVDCFILSDIYGEQVGQFESMEKLKEYLLINKLDSDPFKVEHFVRLEEI